MATGFKNTLALVRDVNYKAPEYTKESNEMLVKEEVINTLRAKVKEDPKASAVFHVLALRERNRHNMTTRGLYYKMRKEGFLYQQKEYAPIFRLLAELGLAKLHTDRKGEVQSIGEFKLPLQKLGALACGENVELNRSKPHRLPSIVKVPKVEAAPMKKQETIPNALRVNLTVLVNNKAVEINLPEDITPEETTALLGRFRAWR